MNNFTGIGRITKDLELRKTGNGKSIVNFTLAINRKYDRDNADFIQMIAWEKTADLIVQHLSKGSRIGVEGRIQTGSYEDKDNKTIYTTEVVVDSVEFLDSKPKESNQQAYTPQANNTQPRQQTKQEPVLDIKDTDLPF